MQLDRTVLEDNIKKSLAVAMERTGMDFKSIDNTIQDVASEFPNTKLKTIIEAIRKGSLGAYGRTYKLNTQEVCFWIKEYLKQQNKSLGI